MSDKVVNNRKERVKLGTKPVDYTISTEDEPRIARFLFCAIAAIIFLSLVFVSLRVGVTGDEYLDGLNGEYSYKYYTEGDTTFADYTQVEDLKPFPHLKYYGSGFEILPAIAVHVFGLPESQLFNFRHVTCAIFGFLLILFTALAANKIAGWRAAIWTLLLMSLTPAIFGLSFFATKDIPFAAGFALANFAFISLYKNLPKFNISHVFLATIGVAMAVSIRIGGLMLPLYLLILFVLTLIFDKDKRQILFGKPRKTLVLALIIGTGVVAVGSFLGLMLYPNFFFEGPVSHIKNALTVVSKFPQRIPMLFDGKEITSLELPDNYLLKSFLYTVPLFVFGALMLFFLNIVQILKKYNLSFIFYVIFTVVFPIGMVIFMDSNVYNGWRHVTFAYGGAAILGGIGIKEFAGWFSGRKFGNIWKYAAPALTIVSMVPTIVWMINNNRYIYSYYNVLAGEPYMRFDLDYYETSQTLLLDWLVENELKDNKDSVVVSARNHNAVDYQEKMKYSNLSVLQNSFKAYANSDADYTILSTHFMSKKYVNNFFPPKGTIKTETINGKPIAALVKRNKLDSKGISLLRENKYEEGLKLLDSSYRYDPNNFGIYFWLGYGNFYNEKYKEAISFFDKCYAFETDNNNISLAKALTGTSFYSLEQFDTAVVILKVAEKITTEESRLPYIHAHIALSYFRMEKYKEAIPYFEKVIATYPYFQGNLHYCRMKAGE